MKKIRYFFIISMIAITSACDVERKIDFESFSILHNENLSRDIHGFIITENSNPLKIPSSFNTISQLSNTLIHSDWLSSKDYLSNINELIYALEETQLKEAQVFINALKQAKKNYAQNILRVNAYAQTLQYSYDKTLDRYTVEASDYRKKITLLEKSNDYYLTNIARVEKELEIQREKYFKAKKSFINRLNVALKDPITTFNINDNLNFKIRQKTKPKCEKFWGDYESINTKNNNNCVYINIDYLVSNVSKNNKESVHQIIKNNALNLWSELITLNGFYDTKTNKTYFKNNLRSQLAKLKNDYLKRKQLCAHTCPSVPMLKQQLASLKDEKNKIIEPYILDKNNKIDIHSTGFNKILNRSFQSNNLEITNPLNTFIALYDNPKAVDAFTSEYAHKIIINYPKEFTISINRNGHFIKPKIPTKNYSLFVNVGSTCSIIYQPNRQGLLPKVISADSLNVKTKNCGLEELIKHNLEQKWFLYA
ncbi:hypothetical protein [Photobacterium sp. SKA34]|uniref:hypothetical protein n=1 Tax=Photobacterium sp. SKA34 TaxID=121723 RepID=UPI0002D6544B|nr:hypothetical protein [Photobacterium sp. SKA34]